MQNVLQSNFFIQFLSIVSVVAGAFLVGFWAWMQEKNKPQPAEQEKLFTGIVKQWHSRSHLDVFNVAWNEIEKDRSLLKKHWDILSVKEFPIDEYEKKGYNEPLPLEPSEYIIEKSNTLESQLLKIFRDPEETIRQIFETKKEDKSDFINIKIFEDINNLLFNKSDDDFSLALRKLRDEGLIHFDWIADGNAQKNMIRVGPEDSFHKNNFLKGVNQMVSLTKELITDRGWIY